MGARTRVILFAAFAVTAVTAMPRVALAEEAAPKRDMPDYDGRGNPPSTPGGILWVPRIIFSPVYFVTEFLIRRPLGFAIAGAERAGLPEILYNFFFFGPNHRAGFAPLVFVDFGFNPSVGLFAFWNDALFKGNDMTFSGALWTNDWRAGNFTDTIHLRGPNTLSLDFLGIRRPDHVFYGIGPLSLQSSESRYGEDRLQGSVRLDFPIWRGSHVTAGAGVRNVNLRNGSYHDEATIEEAAANGLFPLPPGFGRQYTAEFANLRVVFDSRRARPESSSGVRVEAGAELGSNLRYAAASSGWIRYGATAGAFYDIGGDHRVVSAHVTTLFADPIGDRPMPFTELVALGGSGPMRGFFPGRLLDRSAAVATWRYRWPIWVWLDGSLQAAVGNVFGTHLDEFKMSYLRFSSAIGVESVGTPDKSFELLFGIGSETFEQGGKVDSFRVTLGSNSGF